ncbi:MAG: YajQ family cyclic di-GMP-binding protein [Gammaproteobacteria bacterium]|nr:YajQ family cyclic di-GMP-binding protein [Gammaproteobacteria bacterium]
MPSFDIVSEVDLHELGNAVDQANREVANRFDFKGSNAHVEQNQYELTLIAPSEYQVRQMADILDTKLSKRGIDVGSLERGKISESHNEARQVVTVRHGIEQEYGKKLVKQIKGSGLKVQASIQGDQVRVTGKKRDDLQQVIAMLREGKQELPLQFSNFRD